MSVTSGQKLPAPFALFDPESSSWSRSQTSLMSESFQESLADASRTWPKQGCLHGGVVYEVQTLERLIVVNGSSLLPSPRANKWGPPDSHGNIPLPLLGTPTVNPKPRSAEHRKGRAPNLGELQLLNTPTARDDRRGDYTNDQGDKTRPRPSLQGQLKMLPTPSASEMTGGGHRGQGGPNLRTVVADTAGARWQGKAGRQLQHEQPSEIDWGPYEPAIRRWEAVIGEHPPPLIEVKGKPRLNPAFSAWMMALETPQLTRTAALRCVGNAVNPLQGYVALDQLGINA